MNRSLNSALLRETAQGLGVPVPDDAVALFERYAAALVSGNEQLNLTRITGADEIAVQHFADSLAVLRVIPCAEGPSAASATPGAAARSPDPTRARHRALTVVDVGTGGGLPGIALKIACPAWRLTLVESTAKKCAFLREAVASLALRDVSVVCARAEDVGRDAVHREAYDLGVARAVAALPVLVEYVLPLVAVGGRIVLHRGAGAAAESEAALAAIDMLGGRLEALERYELPGLAGLRYLVVVRKVSATPMEYPRRPGVPARRPL